MNDRSDRAERIARIVAHMLRVAKPGDELFDCVEYGPETEDTTTWKMMEGGLVEEDLDSVYPAMHRLPGQTRTLTLVEAERVLVAKIARQSETILDLLEHLEKKWGLTA